MALALVVVTQSVSPRRSVPGELVRHFDEVAVGIAEVHRAEGADGARALDRALLDFHAVGVQVSHNFLDWCGGDETEVGRARGRASRVRRQLVADLVKVELLVPEGERSATGTKRHGLSLIHI